MIKVTASFDDGSLYDLRTADMLNQHGLTATFYIPVNWQRYLATKRIDALSFDDIKQLDKLFTIGSHGVNHLLLTQISEARQLIEINESLEWWTEQGFKVDSFCYPRGYYDDDIKKKVKAAKYKSARTVKIGNLEPNKDPFEIETTVHIGYDRAEYGTDWLTYAKNKIKEAVLRDAEGEDVEFHFWGHSEEIHRYQQWDRFGLLLRYLDENIPT
jgi:peptidoglycan/xylan/chitin deacetylase (PgdA/CDA1 family)